MIVRRYEATDAPRIVRFNERLSNGGVHWTVYPEGREQDAGPITKRLFVAEDADELRGAVWMHEHSFELSGQTVSAGWAKYPVAESLIDAKFGGVPGALIVKLVREQPRLMALGMGGLNGAFARLLKSMRWHGVEVPFLFRLLRPSAVLRNLPAARRTPLRRLASGALAHTGLGSIAWQLAQAAVRTRPKSENEVQVSIESEFGPWADAVWYSAKGSFTMIGRRDAAMLNRMYPKDMPVDRLRIQSQGRDIGWAVTLERDLRSKPTTSFGPLVVGVIADGLCLPADTESIVRAADAHLASRNVDVVFSNQMNLNWRTALKEAGYWSGPSQFAFFTSRALAEQFRSSDFAERSHINRGDCDGPMFA